MDAVRMAGTATKTTNPQNPDENGIAERINQTLMNGTRCILRTAHMPFTYWQYSIRDAAFDQILLVNEATGDYPYTE